MALGQERMEIGNKGIWGRSQVVEGHKFCVSIWWEEAMFKVVVGTSWIESKHVVEGHFMFADSWIRNWVMLRVKRQGSIIGRQALIDAGHSGLGLR